MHDLRFIWAVVLALLAGVAQATSSSALRYDLEYPVIGYSRPPAHNEIARLQAQLDRGEVRLQFEGPRGYLDSVLKALRIDASSQVLVHSKTSLQISGISAETPRAIYFNDDTYVAWVKDAPLLEIATMDSELGAVFYTLHNKPGVPSPIERETSRCLACHDTFSMTGGGVPRFLLGSTVRQAAQETNDRTPLKDRWGGWYVTGRAENQSHLGSLPRFDTQPYLTDKSDIVALLVLEHQLYAKNMITRVNYKSRTFVAKDTGSTDDEAWERMSPRTRTVVRRMTEQLVQVMLFARAAPLKGRITSSAGYDRWFQAQGPRDPRGRSLRDLDLNTRLFKYPLSYVVYSEGFDALPTYVKARVYRRFREILSGSDTSAMYAHLSAADRAALLDILTATKPEFARLNQ